MNEQIDGAQPGTKRGGGAPAGSAADAATVVPREALVALSPGAGTEPLHALLELDREVLRILNRPGDLASAIEHIIAAARQRTGCDAVGVRLQAGEDFPYFAQNGFPSAFLLTENTLLGATPDGGVARDPDGSACLECTCGLVISGKTDPALALLTPGGSFWTNDSFPLLSLSSEQDPRRHPRNQCIHHGYASVALVPIRSQERTVGLLHLNDRRKDCFTRDAVELLEGIAAHIGEALVREWTNQALRLNEERLQAHTRLVAFADTHSLAELLEEALNELEALTGSRIGFFHFVDPDQNGLTLQGWSTRTRAKFCRVEGRHLHYEAAKAGVWVDCLHQRRAVIHNDYASLPHKKGLPPGHAPVVRELAVPVLRGGKVVAILGVGNKPGNYDESDVRLVGLFADLVWDLAAHRRAEAELAASLHEKEALLKEIHHRVKNNLQIIISLLRLQGAQIDSPVVKAALKDMQSRVRSMALIHEHLYRSANLGQVNLASYLKNLCQQLFHTLATQPGAIQLHLDLAECRLGIDQAIPCGLLVNELVSNALKHAFPEGRTGEVRIELQPVADGPEWRLRIADTGVGLPADFDLARLKSLGLQLVPDLARQAGGRLEIGAGPGATFTVLFAPATLHADTATKTPSTHGLVLGQTAGELLPPLFRASPNVLAISRVTDEVVLDASESWTTVLGYTRQEIVGQRLHELALFAKSAEWPRAVATMQANGSLRDFELEVRHKSGDVRHAKLGVEPVTVAGEACRLTILNDVTELRRAAAAAAAARHKTQCQQEQQQESIARLAGGVAHEFNNLLQAILGNAALALEDLPPDSPARESLEEIRTSSQRAADLTRQLLAYACRQTVAPQVLDLNECVENTLRTLPRLLGDTVALIWQPKTQLWPVSIDPTQIDQILANLCINSRNALSGIGRIIIATGNCSLDEDSCTAHPGLLPGNYVRLTVNDNGCGMDQHTREHLFEPFFTTKDIGAGIGMGMPAVYGMVRQNHGFICVDSDPGKGTTVTVYLPRHQGAAAPPWDAAAPRGHETILLVEDEPAILKMTQKTLERLGYSVLVAGTPAEALRLATVHAGKIHLLLTDVIMPEMNGRVLAMNLLGRYPQVRRLFMSASAASVMTSSGVLDDGVHFLHKPFTVKELANKLREALAAGTPRARAR